MHYYKIYFQGTIPTIGGLEAKISLLLCRYWLAIYPLAGSGELGALILQLGTDFVFLIPAGNGILELTMDSLEVLYSETADYAKQDEGLTGLLADTYFSYGFLIRAMDSISKESLGESLMSALSDIFLLECLV